MKLWAKMLDPDFAHSERVARLALELFDGLERRWVARAPRLATAANGAANDARSSIYLASLLHDVGKAKGNKGHHKESLELIKAHGSPLGWEPATMARAGIVARFHCGALPARGHKALRDLLPDEQKITIQLAAILRLANALDCRSRRAYPPIADRECGRQNPGSQKADQRVPAEIFDAGAERGVDHRRGGLRGE